MLGYAWAKQQSKQVLGTAGNGPASSAMSITNASDLVSQQMMHACNAIPAHNGALFGSPRHPLLACPRGHATRRVSLPSSTLAAGATKASVAPEITPIGHHKVGQGFWHLPPRRRPRLCATQRAITARLPLRNGGSSSGHITPKSACHKVAEKKLQHYVNKCPRNKLQPLEFCHRLQDCEIEGKFEQKSRNIQSKMKAGGLGDVKCS